MRILVTNVGSTSLKYRLYDFPEEKMLASGRIERIGAEKGTATWSHGSDEGREERAFPAHREAIEFILDRMKGSVLEDLSQLDCVAFKTVIAKGYVGCEFLNEDVLKAMDDYVFLAPAHNPPYINAVRLFHDMLPETPLIGLFEPAFHRSMPDYARVYPIPKEWREKHKIERYGFHGASHRYVSERVPQLVGRPKEELNVISCHLGGSSSLCAISGGKSIDTSMGFTPQTGVFHAARIGDFDPFAVLFLMREEGYSVDDMVRMLTKESGFRGLSGVSEDMRDIEAAMDGGNADAALSFQSFCYHVKKIIGSYMAVMGRVDVLAFAGGIGERGDRVREEVCRGLEHLGICIDPVKNKGAAAVEADISGEGARTAIWVVPTNEELIVARAAFEKLQSL
ncbi:MAG: acetate/propionate family kinase [Candidatus Omnitrophica bacterium]|nr:acetate/propionate family kinase [Candidatus Omnitrophota bacterium]